MLKGKYLLIITLLFFINTKGKGQLSCSGLTSIAFSYTGAAQTWVVPAGITSIRIKTKGGDGGAASVTSNSSGGGAIIEGEYTVTPGATVTILVGGKGLNGDNESGGGGATGIYIGSTLYIVAGGGGGEDNTGNGGVGVAANNGTDGVPVHAATACPTDDINDSRGGVTGNGGFAGEICAANNNGGGGGGGLNSAGGGKTGNYGGGGQGSITGANGGAAGTGGTAGAWGWSGGGGGDDRESGAGGGYGGGGGAGESGNPGGGGSYIRAGSTSSYTSNGTATTSPVDGTVTICYLVTTPVSLLSFNGISANNCNTLYFTTEQEINVNKFVIERSLNGAEFKNAGEITATNTTTRKNYQFRDCAAGNSEKWLYRIKVLDNDGKYKYSSSIVIKQKGQSTMFAISPNPSADKIYINSSQVIKKIEIINTAGANVISKTNINLTEPVYINTLTPGLYIVKAYAENEILVSKFIKK